jgi:hypothetical protein
MADVSKIKINNVTYNIKDSNIRDSPTFTGTPTAPTPLPGDSSTKIATTAFVEDAVDTAVSNEILYYTAQPVNVATSAEIMRIPASGTDPAITGDTVVLQCDFSDPQNITTDITWVSDEGYISFTGTCTAATTADVVLGKKGN